MGEVICELCGLAWNGYVSVGLARKHECLQTSVPSIEDLLKYLGTIEDGHGCLIPTSPHARPARTGGQHWWLPSAAIRIVGEQYAHRAVLRLKLGRALGRGMVAAHECVAPHYENPQCVNPDHLHERTKSQNAMWMSPERRKVLGGPNKGSRIAEMNRSRAGQPRSREVGIFLTTLGVAELLGVSTFTVRVWADAGKIAYLQTPGGHRRFPKSEVKRMIRGMK